LPIWMDYMGKVLKDMPEVTRAVPEGVVFAPVPPLPGVLADANTPSSDYFYREFAPGAAPAQPVVGTAPTAPVTGASSGPDSFVEPRGY